ncbi:DNA-3-methyladenine glycosylase 2 family protein [Alteromonas ponticola]|uniref:DNA-3-methyladenine glycosylase II n=1 Tax=Alteromonas ponticola TaxID=2720613 RepID=A0ABX1R4Z9_9ALTE|nr:AlkA N-terminal domain-containing protein [Alteromonas ponticola]NMH60833.1 helix-turn-helix domain-containing protein [Alteromonas ponticola]
MLQHDVEIYQAARESRDRRFDGKFFVAVKTTGIFCRPICPARLPAEQNVEYFTLAAQAIENGYRPCLRCRPDSAPGSCAWHGVNTTVTRAQALLSEIPIQSIEHIASRLGVTSRYLNKLFSEYLGVTPKRFQLFNQLMLAKRLLQNSSLSVEIIADAAGFASARRLQSLLQQHWKLTPTAIRKMVRDVSLPGLSPSVQIRLAYRPPYNWHWVRDFLAQRAIAGVETVTENSYSRVFEINGVSGHATAVHNAQHYAFDVEIRLDELRYLYQVIRIISRVLDVDADPNPISAALKKSGLHSHQLCKGLRIPGAFSAFEAGCRAILGQQVSLSAATTQLNKLVSHLSKTVQYGAVFPDPVSVASSDLSFLRMPEQRKRALNAFAQLCCDSKVATPTNDAILNIKGIGNWTLNYFLVRGCGEPDIFLENDLVARNMATKLQIKADMASPWRSYLTLNLWYLAAQEKQHA